jgi:hypothetical protein
MGDKIYIEKYLFYAMCVNVPPKIHFKPIYIMIKAFSIFAKPSQAKPSQAKP